MTISIWSSVDGSSCRHCGAHVSDRFSRVFGDDDDRVHCRHPRSSTARTRTGTRRRRNRHRWPLESLGEIVAQSLRRRSREQSRSRPPPSRSRRHRHPPAA
ncbi:DUF7563 family protein [Natronorubrum thiooxidans]